MSFTIANSGVIASDLTLFNGQTLQIVYGDVFTSTLIDGGGELDVNGSAIASDTTVDTSGFLFINNGGSADTTVLFAGAVDQVFGVETNTTVQSAAALYLLSNGRATDTVVEDGGVEIVLGQLYDSTHHVGPAAIDTTVEAGGFQQISAFGTAVGTDIAGGGFVDILATATIADGEFLEGGTLEGATVHAGGVVFQEAGVVDNLTIEAGGTLFVLPDASPSLVTTNLTIDPGAVVLSTGVVGLTEQNHEAGGLVLQEYVVSNYGSVVFNPLFDHLFGGVGQVFVQQGGTLGDVDLNEPGETSLIVFKGTLIDVNVVNTTIDVSQGVAIDLQVGNADAQGAIVAVEMIENFGSDVTGLIFEGGLQVDAGTTINATVSAGGTQDVTQNGQAFDTTVFSAGVMVISSTGYADLALISAGGTLVVSAGGETNGAAFLANGLELVFSGGQDDGSFTEIGGEQIVGSGGTTGLNFIFGNKEVTSSGVATDDIVSSGGFDKIDQGGLINGGTVESGGTIVVAGTATGVTVEPGGNEIFVGGASVAIEVGETFFAASLIGATAAISSGGIASAVMVGTDAMLSVSNGGVAEFDIVSGTPDTNLGGATQEIFAGGTAIGTDIQPAGSEFVMSSGVASAGEIESAGDQAVTASGTSYAATIMFGGRQDVDGGIAYDAMVANGGMQSVDFEGVASNTTVSSGGLQDVESGVAAFGEPGGDAIGANILYGATQVVEPDAIAEFTFLNSTAIEYDSGTAISTTIGDGGTLYEGGIQLEGTTSGSHIEAGGLEDVGAGGRASASRIDNGGTQLVLPEGFAIFTTVANGGTQIVANGTVSGATIAAGGQQILESAVLSGSETLAAGAVIVNSTGLTVHDGTLTIAGTFDNLADAELDPSTMSVGDLVGSGTVAIGTASTLEAMGTVSADQTIAFVGDAGLFRIDEFADMRAMINGFSSGDTIDLADIGFDPDASVDPVGADGTLTIHASGHVYELALDSDDAGSTFSLADDGSGGTDLTMDGMACYRDGTRIRTDRGDVAIEALRIGDLVVTHAGALRPIRWIGHRSYDGRFVAGNRDALPILLRAGAIDAGVPARDLMVSPRHALFLDGVLAPAERLINGVSIVQLDAVDTLRYFHVELDSHDVLFAEGAAAETFVDCDSRAMFQNAASFASLYPNHAAPVWSFCAPRVEDGLALASIRARLAARAGLDADHVDDAATPGRLDGCIDVFDHVTVAGWAWDPRRPRTAVRLSVLVDGVVVGGLVANTWRGDLAPAGKGDGRCAFSWRLPHRLAPDTSHVVELCRLSDGASLKRALVADPHEPGRLTDTGAPARRLREQR